MMSKVCEQVLVTWFDSGGGWAERAGSVVQGGSGRARTTQSVRRVGVRNSGP